MVRRLARISHLQEEHYTLITYSRHSGPIRLLNHFHAMFSVSDQPIPEALRGHTVDLSNVLTCYSVHWTKRSDIAKINFGYSGPLLLRKDGP